MKESEDRLIGRDHILAVAPCSGESVQYEPSAGGLQGDAVIRALEEYRAALEAGHRPNRDEFLASYPGNAQSLAECLDGLEFVHQAAPQLSQPAVVDPAAAAAEIQPEGPLGDFRIIREIGRGGMGVVYEAVQISLGRRVALKVLPFAAALDSKQLQRFKNEAQAAAHLHHTNIVPVFGVGCERGVHYYAMQFIEGQTLAEVVRDLRQNVECRMTNDNDERMTNDQFPSTKEPVPGADAQTQLRHSTLGLLSSLGIRHSSFYRTVAQLGVQAAEALEHAHQLGIIHRDIKPGNLLVDAGGRLWITDFGLAHCQSQPGLTMSGDVLGTLRYMSPEQALAKRVAVDGRTDVYSLGVTLYELLTLEPAYPGRDREEVLRQIAFEEPRPPRRVKPAVPPELETIVLKAMAKDPGERYATAQELADDLGRFLDDKPIKAKRSTMVQKIKKWARRKPAVAGLVVLSAVAILLLAVVVGGFMLLRETKEQQQIAEQARAAEAQQRQIAEAARAAEAGQRQKAERFQYLQHITLAGTAWRENNTGQLEELLDGCPPDYRNRWEWQYLKRQCHAELLTLEGHPLGGMRSVAFSPDGKRLASASYDGTVKLWDTATGQEERTLRGHKNEVLDVAFSPDGMRLASGGMDGSVKLWDAATGRPEQDRIKAAGPVWSVAFSPDGTRLAFGADRTVKVCDAATGREVIPPLKGHTGARLFVTFSPDGKRLASAGYDDDQMVKLWDTATGLEEHTFRGHADVLSVAFSPDGKRLAGASGDQTVKVWDVASHQEVFAPLQGHTGGVIRVAFSPDGKRLASAGYDKMVKVWDAATGREFLSLRGHAHVVFAVAFSPDGTRLASASQDRTVKFWDATTSQEERTLRGHSGPVAGVAFSPDGERLASAGQDGTVRVWHAATGQEERTLLKGHGAPVAGVVFSADGSQLASAGGDKTVKVWDVKAGRVIRDLDHAAAVRSVAFSPDGKWLASADTKGTLKVWEAATGRQVHRLRADDDYREVRSVTFSADSSRVATASADRVVKVWDTATGQRVHTLEGHLCWVHCVAFSPDLTGFASASAKGPADEHGRPQTATQLASASGDGSVQIWNAITGEHVRSIQSHGNYVRSVAFTRDGTRLASAAGFVRFWDVLTGQEVLSLKGHAGEVLGLAFSPDGTRLASAGQDGTVKVWDSRPLNPQIAVEREALALLDFLFARPLGRAEVEEFLRDSQTIRPEVRQQALAWVAIYHEEQDPKRYNQASWELVRQPYLTAFQYRLALLQAETACRLAPKEESYRTTLGIAQYRARRFQDALATLTRPGLRNQDVSAGLAFLAMTQYRLDQKAEAQATLVRLRQVIQEPRWTQDAEMHGFVREAEALIQSR